MMPAILGDYFELQRGTTYKSALLGQPGPVLLGLGSIARNGGFKGDNLKTYGGPCDPRHLLKPGEIYVSLKDVTQSADLLGAVARVPSYIPLGRLTQDTVKLVFKQEDAPRTYLYWLLQTPQYREYCRAHSTGTTNLGLARDDFLNFEVPSLTRERQWIVDLVQNIEDKIELNRRMNQTLEGIGQAIFWDWFVHFGPTRRKAAGETDPVAIMGGLTQDPACAAELAALFPFAFGDDGWPVSWAETAIGDLVKAQGGSTPSTGEETLWAPAEHYWATPKDLSNMHDFALFDTARKISDAGLAKITSGLLPVGSVLLSSRAPIGYLAIAQVPVAINQGFIGLVPNAEVGSAYLYCWCKANMDKIVANANGSTFQEISKKNFRPITSALPADRRLIAEFEHVAEPLFARLIAGAKESRTLAETRDYLLPRLMSGAVRVKPLEAGTA
ncbi:restriction endonuclease subunit S [Acetobacter tropicalis]|uniref:Type I restriction modification DNA specificity domain-containing protein n=1 Tax=Acetobacter tropicalis TaxID=104102 RepID=A0A251ZZT2_9PROT|nr:restriction endonuclease subunit S [Acetobacter tropicalis]OUI80279.1 hypothetical protein HC62_17940 [Acetobacter tropicalis]